MSVRPSRFLAGMHHISRRQIAGAAPLTLAGVGLIGGGWYARAHYLLPRKQLEAAEIALARRDFTAARSELDLYLQNFPNDPRGHFLMARSCRRAKDLQDAEEH